MTKSGSIIRTISLRKTRRAGNFIRFFEKRHAKSLKSRYINTWYRKTLYLPCVYCVGNTCEYRAEENDRSIEEIRSIEERNRARVESRLTTLRSFRLSAVLTTSFSRADSPRCSRVCTSIFLDLICLYLLGKSYRIFKITSRFVDIFLRDFNSAVPKKLRVLVCN